MATPFPAADVEKLVAGYERAYGDRLQVLPDGAEVIISGHGPEYRQTISRDCSVLFTRPGRPPRSGILRVALLVDRQPFAIITLDDKYGSKQFRVAITDVVFDQREQP